MKWEKGGAQTRGGPTDSIFNRLQTEIGSGSGQEPPRPEAFNVIQNNSQLIPSLKTSLIHRYHNNMSIHSF